MRSAPVVDHSTRNSTVPAVMLASAVVRRAVDKLHVLYTLLLTPGNPGAN